MIAKNESNEQMRAWIDSASYEELLRRNRFAEIGDPIFQSEIGKYFFKIMREKRSKIENSEHVKISKKIGW